MDRRSALDENLKLLYEQLAGKEKTMILASSEEKVRLKQQIQMLKSQIQEFEQEKQQLTATGEQRSADPQVAPTQPQQSPQPLTSPATPTLKTIKIFLASSSELKSDREQFEIFINRKNKEYIKNGTFLELVLWEDFLDAMSQTRLQDEYNKAITDCDIFVSLFYSKVGQYTKEEFLKALETFKANGKPLIYTYFKKLVTEVNRSNRKDFESLFDFQDELSDRGHFYTTYDNIEDLKFKFSEQLVKIFRDRA